MGSKGLSKSKSCYKVNHLGLKELTCLQSRASKEFGLKTKVLVSNFPKVRVKCGKWEGEGAR